MLACTNEMDSSKLSAAVAATSSVKFAKKDGVDFDKFSLHSVRRLSYGYQGVVDQFETSPHIEKVRGVLKDKKYWEACYSVISEEVLGSIYCYYLDEKSFELLTTYRTK